MDKGPEQTLLQREHTDDQQTHEKMFNVTNHQRNVKKTTMRCHLTPVRMSIINKSTKNKCRRGCGERGTLLHCWWECKLVQPLWKAVWRHLKKVKVDLPFIQQPHFWDYIQKNPNTNLKEHKHSVYCSIIYNCQDMEAAQVSINR